MSFFWKESMQKSRQNLRIRSLSLVIGFIGAILWMPSAKAEIAVKAITIKSSHSGWGSKFEIFEINRQGDKFFLNGLEVKPALIEVLAESILAPTISALDLDNIGISKAWVAKNKNSLLDGLSGQQRKLLDAELNNPVLIETAVRNHYKSFWSDDHPYLEVQIKFESNSVTIKSDDQHSFMIPWTIEESGKKRKTFDARISTAIAAILPTGALNKDRLGGANLSYGLNQEIRWGSMRGALETEDANEQFGDSIKKIKQKFKIQSSSVSIGSGSGYEVNGWSGVVGKDGYYQIFIDSHLNRAGKKLPALNVFLKNAPDAFNRIIEVAWLWDWLKAHPLAKIEINMLDGVSVTSKLKSDLLPDLKKNKPDILQTISSQLDQSLYLTVLEDSNNYSRWILLPDKTMLLWHGTGKNVLKWKADDFKNKWEIFGQTGYGAFVKANGEVAP
jgi:hypothetical protein